MLILTAQVLLVVKDQVAWQMKLGWFAAVLASECLAMTLHFWGPWKSLTLSWVEVWARFVH